MIFGQKIGITLCGFRNIPSVATIHFITTFVFCKEKTQFFYQKRKKYFFPIRQRFPFAAARLVRAAAKGPSPRAGNGASPPFPTLGDSLPFFEWQNGIPKLNIRESCS
jgi:hypothetical protein